MAHHTRGVFAGMLLLGASMSASAVAPGGPDCGWGNMLFEGQAGLPSHVVASITNGTSGNATFGMTSGTNGCSSDGALTYGGESWIKLSAMMDEFSEDVARGHGEALDAVAVLVGVKPEHRERFARTLHANFSTLFPHQDVTAEQVVSSMQEVLRADPQLAQYAG